MPIHPNAIDDKFAKAKVSRQMRYYLRQREAGVDKTWMYAEADLPVTLGPVTLGDG